MKGPDMTDTKAIADQLEQALMDRSESRFNSIAFVHRHEIIAALSRPPVAGDGGEALEHLTNVLFADPGPKLAAAHKAARLWWNAQDGLEALPLQPPSPQR